LGTKSKDWAWAKLGIASTPDKDAIHAAYAAKRAELDAEAMRISAFAELTEAREKALFLASELQRDAERSGETSASREAEPSEEPVTEEAPPINVPEPPQEAPAEPEPEPEPEYSRDGPWSRGEGHGPPADNSAHGEPLLPPENGQELGGEWEHGGGYKPAYDLPEDERSEYQPALDPGLDPDPDEKWSHSGSYIPESEKTIDPDHLVPAPSALEEASEVDRKVRSAVRSFFERYPIKTYWVVYAIMALFLVRSCS
jgi:hypothetical protein